MKDSASAEHYCLGNNLNISDFSILGPVPDLELGPSLIEHILNAAAYFFGSFEWIDIGDVKACKFFS